MSRLYQPAQSIDSTSGDRGEPLAFEWRGEVHRALHLGHRWRVHLDWWRVEIWREYFQVEVHTGFTCVVYRDLLTGEWYLERVYD
jgi:hypothetical protein